MTAIRGPLRVRAGRLVVMLILALAASAALTPRADAVTEFYGVNGGRDALDNAADRPVAFQAMRRAGLSYVRQDAPWNRIEPNAPLLGLHVYDWSLTDRFVADLARFGLRWYPMLGYSTGWAASEGQDPFSPPESDADYAAWAAALARRYGPGGTFWAQHPGLDPRPTQVYGIWNEPNNSEFWRGRQATPARYMRLYESARAAIHAVDPAARVTTAGLLDSAMLNATTYLRAMISSSPRAVIDAVGWHPYLGEATAVMISLGRARAELLRSGRGSVPLEVSEVGWNAAVFNASTRNLALASLAAALPTAGLGVERLMPYVWSGSPEWQLTEPDGRPGAGVLAYIVGIRGARSGSWNAPATASTGTLRSCKPKAKAKRVKRSRSSRARALARPKRGSSRCATPSTRPYPQPKR